MDFISKQVPYKLPQRWATPLLFFAAGVASTSFFSAIRAVFVARRKLRDPPAYSSPVDSYLPHIQPSSISSLPYPPTSFIPGARDVVTPYGTIRVYEWGPESASRKVLLLHGISGSCVALLSCAETLVSNGCRVMLVDLFGRGWSGGPADLVYDERLYASQIFMALASSPIAWTGKESNIEKNGNEAAGFSIVGYSLGGAIAANFTSWFPELVQDLALIAPAGFVKSDWKTKLIYSGALPSFVEKWAVKRRLQKTPHMTNAPPPEGKIVGDDESSFSVKSLNGESRLGDSVDIEAVVDWQLKNNPGFLSSFIASIKGAPIRDAHDRWALIGKRVEAFRLASNHREEMQDTYDFDQEAYHHLKRQGLQSKKVLMILGYKDSIIQPSEVVPEAERALGVENLQVKLFDAGHEVGKSCGSDIAEYIMEFWDGTPQQDS